MAGSDRASANPLIYMGFRTSATSRSRFDFRPGSGRKPLIYKHFPLPAGCIYTYPMGMAMTISHGWKIYREEERL